MKLSTMMKNYRSTANKGWSTIERERGVKNRLLRRYASVEQILLPSPDHIEILCDLLGVSPVIVVLGALEDMGLYNPETEGTLTKETSQPADLQDIAERLAALEAKVNQ